MKLHITTLGFILTFFSYGSFGQNPGDLDLSFGDNGLVLTSITGSFLNAQSAVVQPDGKIIVAGARGLSGELDTLLARYNPDGSLDTSFGNNGIVITNVSSGYDLAHSVKLLNDGKILIGGQSNNGLNDDFMLIRYDSNGVIDTSFGNNGIVINDFSNDTDRINSLAILNNGKIIAAGISRNVNNTIDLITVRYNINGSIDSSFGNNGVVITPSPPSGAIYSVVIQDDGKILVGGYTQNISNSSFDMTLLRYEADGSIDTSFGVDGFVVFPNEFYNEILQEVLLQTDNKILAVGHIYIGNIDSAFAVYRCNPDGSLDSSFGNNGLVITDFGPDTDYSYGALLQSDGKIVLAGYAELNNSFDFALARYNTNGSLDASFGNGGKVLTDINSGSNDFANGVTSTLDGGILAYGSSDVNLALAKYLSGLILGTIDFDTYGNSTMIYPNPIGEIATLEYTLLKDERLTIQLYDIIGKQVKEFLIKENRQEGTHKEILDFSELPSGNYILEFSNGYGSFGIKILKI
jgi:uncharacterized delta-60 repeat protein